jgi:acyl carrier protein
MTAVAAAALSDGSDAVGAGDPLLADRRARLVAWIADKSGRIAAEAISDDLPLLEERVLTSLHVIDLILFLEELRDAPIDMEAFDRGAFKSVRTLCRAFLASGPAAAASAGKGAP